MKLSEYFGKAKNSSIGYLAIFVIIFCSDAKAQPGYEPTQYLNLNDYSVPVIKQITTRSGGQILTIEDTREKEYYIDSSTTTFSNLQYIDRIVLKLNYIPKQLIENGTKLESIYIHSQHYKSSNNKEEAILYDTLFDLEVLNALPNLKSIHIIGFYITNKSLQGNTENLSDTLKYYKGYNFSDVDIIKFPNNLKACGLSFHQTKFRDIGSIKNMTRVKDIWFSGNFFHTIPDYLPSSIEKIVVQNCDKLTNIENLSLYPNLKSIHISDGFYIDTIPKSYASNKIVDFNIKLKPEYLSKFLSGFSSVKLITLLNIELYQGIADADFQHYNIVIHNFRLTGTSLGIKTKIKLSNFENCLFHEVLLAGCFDEVPSFTEHNSINKLDFYCYDNMLNNENSTALWKLKDLEKFSIHNLAIRKIPEIFFAQNSNLAYIMIESTDIKKLSFGTTALTQLKTLSIRKNKLLAKIPNRKYFPNAYLDSNENKIKFTRE